MRKLFTLITLAVTVAVITGCGKKAETQESVPEKTPKIEYKDIYKGEYDKSKTFIVISKKDQLLTVYAPVKDDTLPVAQFPVCLSLNKGQKQKEGDMKTPESEPSEPFVIDAIKPSKDWTHDFGDGRGSILAYGAWFLSLKTPGFHGIGIHGSTNNDSSVPGRASEGCIRLHDPDIITLKEQYARVGMPVIIKQEDQGLKPFEIKKRPPLKLKVSE
ncbi:MAG: L,D-transpeptidase [Muribaculaceae bacterium]|nr:L,D-transpeptidase [Muribaculaceae bacterium]